MRRAITLIAAALALAMGLSGCGAPAGESALHGDFYTHDPALVAGGGGEPWFVYSTGNGEEDDGNIQIRSSVDGATWERVGQVWETKPAWLKEAVPGVDNLWAPELYEHGGTWYLYYSASTFGSNRSVVALATNTTLDPSEPGYEWVDRGPVIASEGTDYNAIDPGIVEDGEGTPWMAFGSFHSGIRIVKLQWPDGLRADGAEPALVASRGDAVNAIEAPYILERDGWFYLFVSKGFCCRGLESTYSIAAGRSKSVTGPYVDANGVGLLDDGGTPVMEGAGDRAGPGGQSVSGGILAFHYYSQALDGAFRLGLVPLRWEDGWPVPDE
ncbi:arabinan endo-1,5-alpha-L-arabinosidase [Arthrobacter stackebrandtii]|uniref:Arabinan endo-1,5-alpha-L-arabinosidase n=1 Tax=Arthrobacter stackebrandtii TaxID=272161 RepID=A0ABS4YZD3_9MICC|nr:arabinan endo-1,5-alpha-L-arabinosidase [Arthrobacter stackebrandtii]MBP2414151.1 arabinan endo-1,5-alpha-L-arabinosidase [Arthrobacter stackebrandtii]PYG99312.1 arabinan endo-1,5-alpha-L-arabinosidase [Arthrobacter stackebrandtii]